jgi:hypothetical protein
MRSIVVIIIIATLGDGDKQWTSHSLSTTRAHAALADAFNYGQCASVREHECNESGSLDRRASYNVEQA